MPQREQQRTRSGPDPLGRAEHEGRELHRVGQVAGESAVMLADHHAVEARRFRQARLTQNALHDLLGRAGMGIEAERHLMRGEGLHE